MIAYRLMTIPAAERTGSFWLPEQASSLAPEIDETFWLVMWISVVFFVIIVAGQAYFMYAYRRRAGWVEQRTAHHNYVLELSWSIIPSLLAILIFVKGFIGFLDARTPPENAYDITVVAKKWSWAFVYPNGTVSSTLHVPIERPVRLVMSSDDVIHSFFVPAFRVKQDVVPGRYNYVWFDATKDGTFPLECTEYCGTNHSEMITTCVVHKEGCFEQWLEEERDKILRMPPIELGELLYNERGCAQCHKLDESRLVGPGFAQTYGENHQFEDGTSAEGDENYIRESIINPQAHVRQGYPPTMPTYKGLLDDAEIDGLVSFIKSKKPGYKPTPEDTQPRQPEDEPAAAGGGAADGAAGQGAAPAGETDEAAMPNIEC